MADGNDSEQFPSGSHDPFDRIPVEINEIVLAHLPIADILSCGLVNKSWKKTSRSYLQSHRKCFAHIKNPCKDLLALNNHMSRYDLSMINGVHIRNENPDKWADIDVVDCCRKLMQFPLKYLYVDMSLEDESECVVKIVKALIRETRMSLKELSACFSGAGTTFFDFLLNDKEIAFPKLTVIENLGGVSSRLKYQLLPAIAPKLQHIYGVVPIGPSDSYSESVVSCIREVAMEIFTELEDQRSTLADPFARTLVTRLSNLLVFEMECHEHPPEDYRPSLELNLDIMHNNCNTLERIVICPFDLLQYVKDYPMVKFPKLTVLDLTVHSQYEDIQEGYAKHPIFQHVSTPEFFPSLQRIKVSMDGLMSEETEPEPLPEPLEEASSVNSGPLVLKVASFMDDSDKISVFGKLSQRLTTLKVDVIGLGVGDFFHLAEAFVLFPLLEELVVYVDDAAEYGDYVMDAFLCGIHVDEVVYLSRQHRSGDLDLQQLNIVPLRPPITFTQNLTKLRLRYIDIREDCQTITEVSGCLAFGRMPHVVVTIQIDVKYRHECANLTRFANIVYTAEDDRMAHYSN